MKNRSLNLHIWGAVFVILVGGAWHFVYAWSGNNFLVGLIAPINESVWEHMKLAFFPLLFFGIYEYFTYFKNTSKNYWFAHLVSQIFIILFIITFFYTYNLFLDESLFLDILSFVIGVILGRWISYSIIKSNFTFSHQQPLSITLLALMILFFIYATIIPPKIDLFVDHSQTIQQTNPTNINTISETNKTSSITSPSATSTQQTYDYPINDFLKRITKKPFGIYITPTDSPIQPEKFTGYHTGVDVEYEDIDTDVDVYAITDAKVIYSGIVSGYGGVVILQADINGENRSVLYGHLRPSSLPKVDTEFRKGEKLAVLGTGYSSETDNERKHLHFAILSDDRVDFTGYVQDKNQLSNWLDPISLYQ